MPEEPTKETQEPQEPQETQQTQQTQQAQAASNGAPTAEELAAIKAELQAEGEALRAARSNLEHAQAMIQEKDALIADLQTQLTQVKSGSEAAATELTKLKDAHSKAVGKYLDAVKLANPTIPGAVIAGSTIDEIDASLAKALSIATAVKASLEAQAKQARVPAGAPTRTTINLEGLSPREKIAAGIQQGSQR